VLEIEVRCFLTPEVQQKLSEKLQQITLLKKATPGIDLYYDTTDLALLRHRQAVFARIRGDHLQLKFDEDQESRAACVEREFSVAKGSVLPESAHALFRRFLPEWQTAQTWEDALARNCLMELVRIEKVRSIYTDGIRIISLDQVKGLGNFVEVEMNCEEGADINAARTAVRSFVTEIGGQRIKAGYFEMWLWRNNHTAYEQVPPQFRLREGELPLLSTDTEARPAHT
jgi:adenylate cyclase class IV